MASTEEFALTIPPLRHSEEIATALLQLANNPALFYKWALKNGQAVKADGQLFSRAE